MNDEHAVSNEDELDELEQGRADDDTTEADFDADETTVGGEDETVEAGSEHSSDPEAEASKPAGEASQMPPAAGAGAGAAKTPQVEVVRGEREFHISGTVVKENDSTAGLSNEEARNVLKTMFPEVANATMRASVKDGVSIVEFLPQPGRKG